MRTSHQRRWFNSEELFHFENRLQERELIVPIVDTTGCGDVFHGGFIYGLLKNWPVEVSSEFASAVAAIKCEKLGGRAGCPSFEEARNFLLSFGSKKMKSFLGTVKSFMKEISFMPNGDLP